MSATCATCGQTLKAARVRTTFPEIVPVVGREDLYAAWKRYTSGDRAGNTITAPGIKPAGIRGASAGARAGYNTRRKEAALYEWLSDAWYAGLIYDYTLPSGDCWEIVRDQGDAPEQFTTAGLKAVLPELVRVRELVAA